MKARWQPINVDISIVRWHDDTVSVGRAIFHKIPGPTDGDAVAHCYVTEGVIARSALIRVMREGIRICPLPGQQAALDVLQNTDADDTEEVREGCKCTLRVRGFLLLRGDVVEAYRVETV
jgi:translation initiation factor IF-2